MKKTVRLLPGGAVTREITLQPGKSWQTVSRIQLYEKLGNVTGVEEDIIGSITLPPPPTEVPLEVKARLSQ